MLRFLSERLAFAVATLLLVATVVFFLARLTGDATALLTPIDATPEMTAEIQRSLGLDRPLAVQYFRFLIGLLNGDLGVSYASREFVTDLIAQRAPASFFLISLSILMALPFSIPLGLWAGANKGSALDAAIRAFAFLAQAVPSFFVGVLLVRFVAGNIAWLPTGGWDGWTSPILPVLTLALFLSPAVIRLLRSSTIEVMQSDYVRMARLKGLSERRVLWKHVLKNACLPVLALTGLYAALSITIAVVVEVIFAWPGLGHLAYMAIVNRDFAVLQGIVVVATAATVTLSFFVDWLSAVIDPRLRASAGR